MLAASTLCFTFTVIMGIWIATSAYRGKRPLKILLPLHVGFAIVGATFLLIALNRGDQRLMLNVALAVAVAAFGVIMAWSRRRGYVIVPLFVCHVILGAMFYLSLACFTLFPKF
ncbi:hypothetical protein [Kozakia baliensis]|uniref:Uncharacterized protein n=1 Tax=Kozakia baliensis TaxID=153496 RepID=A0A1D8UQV4_9PROT|nr:hypothetical protein [Kozakia baliensis]AOX16035.1 hypothetical protein A0U89_01550 [Kozakia baliensis]AOX19010.1 hypothetical protein A0U90_00370 [Kozakia baliensis]GBR23781.1 hypothetical protein AA0488_0222 [Kozakia baliensis NRIC 0488]GEL65316.1 hypothetical protein KBA01_26020 [Kozakia baliensis]